MKGNKTLAILNKLAEGAMEASDLFIAYSTAGYGTSSGRIERQKEKIEAARRKLMEDLKEKQRFHSLMHKLKKQGLVNKATIGDKFYTTKRGILRRKDLIKRRLIKSLPSANYPTEKTDSWILVAFDIPEKERHKRNWLRSVLAALDFEKVQNSVFIGRARIPEELLEDLQNLKLRKCVEILEIKQTGTLKRKNK